MDWSRLKTIFIIAFLILNVFLFIQLVNKQNLDQLEVKTNVSLEENLENDGIKYGELPKEPVNDQYLSANTKKFSEEEVKNLEDQVVTIKDDVIIHAGLMEPIEISDKFDVSELDQFVKQHILYGNEYGYGHIDKEEKTITYYQKYRDKLFFMNKGAHLVFYFNDDHEVYAYEQTMLDMVEPINDKEEVLPAIRAIETLYRKGMLKPDSKIARTELGYYTVVSMESSQVLTPTWHFVIERDGEKEQLLVNAFEGQVIQLMEREKNKME